jgi:peptidoglycan/xylan/chitin deacetylase (PgdA/CDA1 family)
VGRILILLYHRVAEPRDDPFQLAVSPDNFESHLRYLSRRGGVVPLTEVHQRAKVDRIAITFDDGYRDNAETAAPALASAGLPVTWFITVGLLGGKRFWWDRLTDAVLGPHNLPDALKVDLPAAPVWVDLRTRDARERALNLFHHRIRPLPPPDVESTVDAVCDALGVPSLPSDATTVTRDQLLTMSGLPGADVGAHTLTHVQLRGQPAGIKRREIVGSVEALRSLTGRPVTSFAYPFGSPRAVDSEAQRLVREAECTLACSTNPGLAAPRTNRYLLPRMAVGDWPGDVFAERIEAAFKN